MEREVTNTYIEVTIGELTVKFPAPPTPITNPSGGALTIRQHESITLTLPNQLTIEAIQEPNTMNILQEVIFYTDNTLYLGDLIIGKDFYPEAPNHNHYPNFILSRINEYTLALTSKSYYKSQNHAQVHTTIHGPKLLISYPNTLLPPIKKILFTHSFIVLIPYNGDPIKVNSPLTPTTTIITPGNITHIPNFTNSFTLHPDHPATQSIVYYAKENGSIPEDENPFYVTLNYNKKTEFSYPSKTILAHSASSMLHSYTISNPLKGYILT